jgi:large conductance mechanosensitive channel
LTPERGEVERAVLLERRNDRGQDLPSTETSSTTLEGSAMLQEFKDFLFRGNIIELAVAFVMGLAFATVVNSLVDNLVMPVIAMIIGKPDFSDLTFTINDAVFRYGQFITDLIQFVAIAAAVFFFIVKPVQGMLARRRREPVEEGMLDEERRHQELLAALGQVQR